LSLCYLIKHSIIILGTLSLKQALAYLILLGTRSTYYLLSHHIRHRCVTVMDTAVSQCGPVLSSLPSTGPPLFKLCQTTINQHKLISLTTSLTILNAPQFLAHFKHKQQTAVLTGTLYCHVVPSRHNTPP